ncbi:MAG: hypothetical protein J5988_04850 [Eubacterium sp.]|nr:hypothetical protein [Eubacterium sp.]
MKEPKINIGNSQKEKIITKELKITKNVFIYNETMIQLCNISRVSVADAVKDSYPLGYIAMLFIGFIMLFTKMFILILAGLVLMGLSLWLIYRIYRKNQNLGEYLVLNLNSGRDIYLYSNNHNFTIEVMDVIINCINSGKEYRVNMENCHIEACQFGEDNVMNGEKNEDTVW